MSSNLLQRSLYRFCFFNQQISEKYGKKCCRYHQNGIPLDLQTVNKTHASLKQFLEGWKVREQGKRLVRHFYVQSYPKALEYLQQVVTIDENEFKQCPTYQVKTGELLTLELFSISLKGLSMVDFHLAMRINNIDYRKFSLINITNEEEYKKEYNKVQMQREAERIQKQLDEDMKDWDKNPKRAV